MDFVNKAVAQVSDLFRSMTPAARITTGLLLGVLVVSLGYLFNHQGSGPDAYLMGGEMVSSSQIPSMEAAFAKAGLNTYQIDGNRIRVPRSQQSAYMGALADAGALPHGFGEYLQSTIDKGGPFVSKQKQAEMVKIATQSELAQILRSMKDIENASVLYDVQTEGNLHGTKIVTASVSIKPMGNNPLDEERVPAIRQLVAAAIAGLSPDNVAVTDLNGARFFPMGSGGQGAGSFSEYGNTKRTMEKDWEKKIREMLHYMPGVVVAANVELSPETEHVEDTTSLDSKPVQTNLKESTRTSKSTAPTTGGQPGVRAQGAIAANSNTAATVNGAASGPTNETEESDTEARSAYGQTAKHLRQQGLLPQKVTVSIGIPSGYFDKVWREQHPTAPGAEPKTPDPTEVGTIRTETMSEVRKAVGKLVPPEALAKDSLRQIEVTTFQSLTSDPLPQPSVTDHAMAWFGQYWSTLGMGCLGLFSLVVLRSMVRSVPTSEPPAPQPLASTPPPETEEEAAAAASKKNDEPKPTPQSRLKRRGKSGPSLRDELAEIVREDPDAAANILRTWIGSAT